MSEYDDFPDVSPKDMSHEDQNVENMEVQNDDEKFHGISIDFLIGFTGICMAVGAAFLPWYVFLNQDKFSVREMAYGSDRELPDWQGRAVVNVSPQAIPKKKDNEDQPLPADQITTASLPNDGSTGLDANQPFPGKPRFKLLHIVNQRVLIEDESGMYVAKIGSILPDNSTIDSIERRDGKWAVITSNGDVLKPNS